jgi:hypothetical protein
MWFYHFRPINVKPECKQAECRALASIVADLHCWLPSLLSWTVCHTPCQECVKHSHLPGGCQGFGSCSKAPALLSVTLKDSVCLWIICVWISWRCKNPSFGSEISPKPEKYIYTLLESLYVPHQEETTTQVHNSLAWFAAAKLSSLGSLYWLWLTDICVWSEICKIGFRVQKFRQ